MSFVKVKNITAGKLVFLAVRDSSDQPLTLEAGEEKDVHPSMASQPSFKRVLGTKVVVLSEQEALAAIVAPKVTVVVTPPVEVKEDVAPVEEVLVTPISSEEPFEDNGFRKSRNKGRR